MRGTRIVRRDRYVKVVVDSVERPSGELGEYTYLAPQDDLPGAVVVAVSGGDTVAMVRQVRHPVGRWLWELPRGFGDEEHPEGTASRELQEETGLQVAESRFRMLGWVLPDSGVLRSRVGVCAVSLGGGTADLVAGHGIDDAAWVPISELWTAAQGGCLVDGITLSALAMATAAGVVPPP